MYLIRAFGNSLTAFFRDECFYLAASLSYFLIVALVPLSLLIVALFCYMLGGNQDLYHLKESGKFRKDLFFRLNVHNITLPPLWERLDDLPLLVDYFLMEAAEKLDKKKPTPPPELITLLSTYHFPGNIRELRSMIFDAVSTHKSRVLSLDSFKNYFNKRRDASGNGPSGKPKTGKEPLIIFPSEQLPSPRESQAILITEAMKRAKNNQSVAAQLLGISRQALNRRLKQQKESVSF